MTQKKIILNGIWLIIYTIGIFFLGCGFQLYNLTGTMGDYTLWNEVELVEGCGHSWYRLISGSGGTVAIPIIIGFIFLISAITIRIPELYHYFKKKENEKKEE